MATILYLSNRLVQVIDAREKGKAVTVHNIWQEEAPEGSIINGIITDEEAFLSWIKGFFTRNKLPKKEIVLVVNSSQFGHKVLEFPKIKEAEIRKMIPKEFSENRTENTLFTHCILEGEESSKSQKVLATAVEKDFLLSYINLFKQAGIEIAAMDSGISAMVRLFMHAPEIKKKTCLIQILDGEEVISMLFVKGMYYYSQKNRLFDVEFTEDCQRELESITDKLLQFVTSQQIKEPVETLYLCGEGQKDLVELMPGRRTFRGDKIISFAQAGKKGRKEFPYAAGYLLGMKQGNSLYKQIRQEQKEKKKRKEILSLCMPSIVVLAACLIIAAIMGSSYLSGLKELRRLQSSMQETDTVNAHASYELSTANVASLEEKIKTIETTWSHLMSYPTMNSSIQDILFDCAGEEISLSVKSFQRDSGVLSVDASAKDVRSINAFIAKLQEQECFEAVEYSGYTYVSGVDQYNIHVVLCMAEGAGR